MFKCDRCGKENDEYQNKIQNIVNHLVNMIHSYERIKGDYGFIPVEKVIKDLKSFHKII